MSPFPVHPSGLRWELSDTVPRVVEVSPPQPLPIHVSPESRDRRQLFLVEDCVCTSKPRPVYPSDLKVGTNRHSSVVRKRGDPTNTFSRSPLREKPETDIVGRDYVTVTSDATLGPEGREGSSLD